MATSVTITGKTGPDRLVENMRIDNVGSIELDLNHQVVRVTSGGNVSEFDMRVAKSFQDKIEEGNHNIVIE